MAMAAAPETLPAVVGWRCPQPAGGTRGEWALAVDRGRARRLLIVPALFDEANRMRRLCVEVMRRLDGAGIDSLLPDLPGWGDSLADPAAQTIADWRRAMADLATDFGASAVLSIRGGALIAPPALPGWRLSPATGARLLRQLLRAEVVAAREAGRNESVDALLARGKDQGIAIGGHGFSADMVAELLAAVPEPGPQAEIAQDMLGGGPLWLRAEPGFDGGQADALAAIVAMAMPGDIVPPPPFAACDLAASGLIRSALTFMCAGEVCHATLDRPEFDDCHAPALLFVSGGSEVRSGHAASQARAAATLAAAGFPVLRWDRRGVGDSTGEFSDFAATAPDIAAALAALAAARPQASRIVAYGICDGASALMLSAAGLDDALRPAALILGNPWTFAAEGGGESVKALRAHYRRRLTDLAAIERVLTGRVRLVDTLRSLARAVRPAPPPGTLAQRMAAGLAAFKGPARILVGARDYTAQAFLGGWDAGDPRLAINPDAGHIFAETPDWWHTEVTTALRGN